MEKRWNKILYLIVKDWKRYLVILTPFIFLWIPLLYESQEAKCGYVITIMATYYMTEALPLAVTALIPVFAFPSLGIMPTEDICMVYMKGTTMMFFGGLAAAVAVEHSNLHKRIALFVILKIGQSPRRIMVSFMLTSMFLSMWISNTAACAMMVPILDAILQELYKHDLSSGEPLSEDMRVAPSRGSQLELVFNEAKEVVELPSAKRGSIKQRRRPSTAISMNEDRLMPPDEEGQSLSTMYYLATAYASNIGGTGFPTGTGPNLVLWGILHESFPGGTGLNFMNWMLFNIPGMLVCCLITWLWLDLIYLGFWRCRKVSSSSEEKERTIKRLVQKHYESLGPPSFHEIAVLSLFFLLVCLWIFRAPGFVEGWAEFLQDTSQTKYQIGNASAAILIIFLFFVVPSRPPWRDESIEPTPACLTWDALQKKIPWGLILLVGGGFAMAEGTTRSGLSKLIRVQLQFLKFLPRQAIVFFVCFLTTFMTEILSNITAASILLPLLRDLAIGIEMNPLYLLLPATVCCSYAFMLPVSNPPNAIVFTASNMKMSDMIKTGFVLKILTALVMTLLINTLGVALFDLHTFPDWARPLQGMETSFSGMQNVTTLVS